MANSSFWFAYFACLSLCCSLLPPTFTLPIPFAYEQVYHKISENKPRGFYFSKALFGGLIFGGAYLQREILRFKIDWASLIVEGKLTVFALFYFVFDGNFQVQAHRGGFYLEGRLNRGFFCITSLGGSYLEGLIFRILWYSYYSVYML